MNKSTLKAGLCLAAIALSVAGLSVPAVAGIDEKAIETSLESGDTTGALSTLTEASKADSKDYLALYWLGRIAYARGQWQDARDYFQRAFDIKSKHYESLYYLALSQMHLGEFEAAYANLRKGSKKARTMRIEFKGAEDTLSRLQEEFARTGGLADNGGEASHASMSAPSEEDLRAKVKSEPREALNHFALGKFLYDQGRYAEADSSFLIALKRDKDHDLSNYFHGLTLIKLGKLNEAEKLFEERLKKSKAFKAEYNNGLGLVFLTHAEQLAERGEQKELIYDMADKADGQFRAALAFDPENCTFHLNLAQANYLRDVFASAKAEYEEALSMCPGDPEVQFRYAETCFKMRDYTCALEQLNQAIAADSANPDAWKMLGSISFGAARGAATQEDAISMYKNAIGAYRKYAELSGGVADSTNAQAYYDLATALLTLNGYEEAIENYKKVLAVPVEPPEIYLSIGKAYAGLKRWSEALEYYEKHNQWALSAGSDYKPTVTPAQMDRYMGEAYYGLKEYISAVPYLVRSYEADTTQTRLLINIALSYHNVKEYRKALPYYENLLSRDLGEQVWSLYLNGAFAALAIANGDGEEEVDEDEMDEMLDPTDSRAPSDYQRLAVQWLQKVLEYKPDNERALSLIATTYLYDLGDCENGVKWYTRVHEKNLSDCEALRSLGYAYFGGVCTKNYGKAISYLGQALDCYDGDPCASTEITLWIAQAYHLRAVAKVENKEKEAARPDFKKAHEWYSKVLECDPGNTDAQEGKSQVEFEF